MRCPGCQLELGIERRADELVVTYSFKDWTAAGCHCRERGDPVLCCKLLPAIVKLMANGKATSAETGKPSKRRAS